MVTTLLAKLKALKQFYKRFTDLCNNLCVLEKMLPTGHSKETNLTYVRTWGLKREEEVYSKRSY